MPVKHYNAMCILINYLRKKKVKVNKTTEFFSYLLCTYNYDPDHLIDIIEKEIKHVYFDSKFMGPKKILTRF